MKDEDKASGLELVLVWISALAVSILLWVLIGMAVRTLI